MGFVKAVKRDAKLRLALCGPAGSGKTYSLLSIGSELGGPIAYVDTEHGSASKYADIFRFDVIEPDVFDPRDLIKLIKQAIDQSRDDISQLLLEYGIPMVDDKGEPIR